MTNRFSPDIARFSEMPAKRRLRRFSEPDDLSGMCNVLVRGRNASLPAYYVHTGDLKWWLYFLERDLSERIYIWEEVEKKRGIGWVLFSLRFRSFDVFVDPVPVYQSDRLLLFKWAEEESIRF
jgi:hypothetical protein